MGTGAAPSLLKAVPTFTRRGGSGMEGILVCGIDDFSRLRLRSFLFVVSVLTAECR